MKSKQISKQVEISHTDTSLEIILRPKTSIWATSLLGFLTILSAGSCIGGIFKAFWSADFELTNLLISLALMGLASLYLGRLFLWNQFGKEILLLEKDTFQLSYDYALFQEKQESIPYRQLQAFVGFLTEKSSGHATQATVLDELGPSDADHLFCLQLDQHYYQSVVQLSTSENQILVKLVNQFHRSIPK
ncbi:MAG: hypothetical protein AB8G15_13670 [Saprospiraceae bacterium]